MLRIFKPLTPLALGAALCCSLLLNAQAVLVEGDSTGKFINPVAGADNPLSSTSGVGTANFSWGIGLPDESSLSYQHVGFSSPTESAFKIGTLTYHNGTVVAGTAASGVTLDVAVSFTTPSGINQSFDYAMTLINTPNSGSGTVNADYVTLGVFPAQVFTIGATTYTLTLGFDNLVGGGFLQTGNQLHVLEGQTATADLKGTVTTNTSGVPGVPDGGVTLSLLGGAVMALGAFRRKFNV